MNYTIESQHFLLLGKPSKPETKRMIKRLARMTTTKFSDANFDSTSYAKYRPDYPPALFTQIYKWHKGDFNLVVDVATGTGQAALELTKTFKSVIGTDLSAKMLQSAVAHPCIQYLVAPAEEFPSEISPNSVDLITVAQAAHWFDMAKFYADAHRVLKPKGTLAIWGYYVVTVPSSPELTRLMNDYFSVTVGPYWDTRRHRLDRGYIDEDYLNTPFPRFSRNVYPNETQDSCLTRTWSLAGLGFYLKTWSAYKSYMEVHSDDPVDALLKQMMNVLQTNDLEFEVELVWPYVMLLMSKD